MIFVFKNYIMLIIQMLCYMLYICNIYRYITGIIQGLSIEY